MSEQRLDLQIESTVVATDGPCGNVQQLVIDPHGDRVTALAVLPNTPFAYPVLVPLDRVAGASDGEVQLTLSRAAMDELSLFDLEQHKLPGELDSFVVVQPQAGAEGGVSILPEPVQSATTQPPTAQPVFVLRAGQRVLCTDGEAGKITLLLTNPRGQVRHFVLRTVQPAGREVIVPADWVREVDRNNVHLSVACGALEEQPDYRPDHEIACEIERVLWDDDVLREMAYHRADVSVNAGTVTVRGHVRTSAVKERVERVIRGMRSVLGVENRLVADDVLANAVAEALSHDNRLRGQSVRVQAHDGFVTLTGDVRDADTVIAAEQAAASLPMVRGVINRVCALGVSVIPEAQRVVQPYVGQEIFATDGPLGHVERVVISPRNRRVTAVVARGWFPDPQRPDQRIDSDTPVWERRVVIPVSDVRQVTAGGVWLRISRHDAARGRDIATAGLVAPDAGWQPPFPYTHGEVLLDLG